MWPNWVRQGNVPFVSLELMLRNEWPVLEEKKGGEVIIFIITIAHMPTMLKQSQPQ